MKARKFLSLALALVLCLGLLPAPAGAVGYTEVVPCKYGDVLGFSEGLAAVCEGDPYSDGKWGFIDKTGNEVIPCRYDEAWSFSDGLAAVGMYTGEKGEYGERLYKWSYIDKSGKEVITCKYDMVYDFHDGLAAVELGIGEEKKYAFINKAGKEVVPPGRYDDIKWETWDGRWKGSFDGMTAVCVGESPNKKWGFIDNTGKEVIPCQYSSVENFSEGYAGVCKEGNVYGGPSMWGFIDTTGKEVVPCVYYGVGRFSEGLAAVGIATGEESEYFGRIYKRGFIDKTGKEVIPCKYEGFIQDTAPYFSEGLAAIYGDTGAREEDGRPIYRYGFIDKTGKLVIPYKYVSVASFSDELTAVSDDTNYKEFTFIDKTGRELGPNQYDGYMGLPYFSEGYASVAIRQGDNANGDAPDLKWGFIDNTGAVVVPCQYDNFYPPQFSEGLAAVEREGMWGFISMSTPSAPTAQPSTQTVNVDGKPVQFAMYALNGGSVNYIRVRDLAALLNGTAAQFDVGWNGSVTLTGKTPYTGSADKAPFHTEMPYTVYTSPTYVNGNPVTLDAIQITYNGGGYTYYKLRDLAQALGFNVGWSAEKGIYVETDKPYDPNN